jgi:hypothetical protein
MNAMRVVSEGAAEISTAYTDDGWGNPGSPVVFALSSCVFA